ncbi:MAG: hypothetical protein MUE46_10330 [Xanthomonadales bacterium]|jgi:hypothetical protein|nr:hypothetical protein [Xanthomonadales bacterium]
MKDRKPRQLHRILTSVALLLGLAFALPVSAQVSSTERNTLLVNADGWKYVYCSSSSTKVKVTSDASRKQRWVKPSRSRQIYNETVNKYLYCPERDGGLAPTDCVCSTNQAENYHEKTSAVTGPAPASITLNRSIYLGPNNNFNACLKVIRGNEVHAPCAITPWRNQNCRAGSGTSFTSAEHAQPCFQFRLNN